ncbi:hypothetical protein COV06_01395 [Candidatus Uhrbacteria bacterium CG10_big_fil_rev_8_21_14_0_10_50_16]|uniref:Uncharacterized protein n=1 Tax=Candidatus Uhrbacteria bacterium CG10_big_fil_rev_8_21_14_0_10_50_16 TaxID=1975039 RepID=A0A2H0RQK3_9BACT|nr:MAG: hypothetical protein COV06_01395 [Candidatus Uhrbacteria bacterium CG10_big_fil_rev_8_21_14_0_10_50_16]
MKRSWRGMVWLLALLLLMLCAIASGRESWEQHARAKEFDRLVRERRELKEKLEPNPQERGVERPIDVTEKEDYNACDGRQNATNSR